jgi:hypothetical protein
MPGGLRDKHCQTFFFLFSTVIVRTVDRLKCTYDASSLALRLVQPTGLYTEDYVDQYSCCSWGSYLW